MLRYAFRVAETGFDPASVTDLYSAIIIADIFEAPYEFEFLARPVRLRPSTALALPEASDDFKTFTIRLKPGIFFTDDPAFKGKPRELVAADYVYSIKRHRRPALEEPASVDASSRSRSSASTGCARPRWPASPSTTTARSKGCARSTATRCRSSWRAPTRVWPRC